MRFPPNKTYGAILPPAPISPISIALKSIPVYSADMLEVRLLGQWKIRLDGRPVEIASRPAQSLFAYLALNPMIEHRREKLAGLLWPDSTEANARNNLRQALWRIRKAIEDAGHEVIVANNLSITFLPGSEFWLDAAMLERDVPEDRLTDELIEDVSLYEGDLLPGFYEDWAMLAREHLHAVFERKMQCLLEGLVQQRRWQRVLEWGERWIAEGQSPELAYRAMMLAHAALGDTSSVASVYQRCVQALREELGVDPSEETRNAYERLSRGEKLFDLHIESGDWERGRKPIPSMIPPPHYPDYIKADQPPWEVKGGAFVARERELARLKAAYREAMAGNGRVMLITGDSGSGKTALMRAFALQAQGLDPQLLVVFGECNALTGIGDPYLPFREALGLLLGEVEAKTLSGLLSREQARRLWANLPYAIGILLEEAPDLLDSFVSASALLTHACTYNPENSAWIDPLEGRIERRSAAAASSPEQADLFGQYTRFLQALAHRQPLILILDDLQWADLGSISLLFHLGRRIAESRLLLLGAYRPEEIAYHREGDPHPLAKVVAEFKRNYGDIILDLREVKETEGRHFVDAYLDSEPNRLGEGFRQALYRQTAGHPLFTIELLRAMEARGDIAKDQHGCWVEVPSLDWERLPARVEGVIEERISRLEHGLRHLLAVASVEGEEFTAEVIGAVLGLDSGEVIDHLSHRLDKEHRLVLAQGTRRVGGRRLSRYRFRHTLFEKHLYSGLDAVECAHLHERVGEELESLYEERCDEIAIPLAHHFAQAGELEKAIIYYEIAGDRAKRLSANEEAIDHFNKAIEMLRTLPESPERDQRELALQIALGAPLIVTQGYGAPEVERVFARAHALSLLVLEPPQLFPVIYGLRSYYLMQAQHRTALEIAEQLLTLAEKEGDAAFFLQAHEALGSTLFYLGELDRSREHLQRGIDLYDPRMHQAHAFLYGQDPGVACMSYMALALWNLGYPDQGRLKSQQALDLARELEHPFSLALALDFAASFHTLCREGSIVREYAQEAIALSRQHHFPLWEAMGLVLLGWAAAELGKVEKGISQMAEGLGSWQASGAALGRPHFVALMAETLGKAGRHEEGANLIMGTLQDIHGTGERMNEAELHRLLGELLGLRGGASSEIEAEFQQAVQIAGEQGARGSQLRAALSLSQLWLREGKRKQAKKLISEACAWFEEGFESSDLRAVREVLAGL